MLDDINGETRTLLWLSLWGGLSALAVTQEQMNHPVDGILEMSHFIVPVGNDIPRVHMKRKCVSHLQGCSQDWNSNVSAAFQSCPASAILITA